jgi:erythromycin esterase-like protein
MLLNGLGLLLSACPIAILGQSPPIQDFRLWSHGHVHPIASVDDDSRHDADLQVLKSIVGSAHVVALGEPIHNDHETLAIRNRLIRYGVKNLGFRAVALETCLSSSKLLYDYVLGRSPQDEPELKKAFCYGFGDYPENMDLIRWLHTYNATQPSERKVRFYGIDLSGQYSPTAFRSLDDVLNYLDHANPALGREARVKVGDLTPVFRTDRYIKLTDAEKNACTGKIQDLIALMRRERTTLTNATSTDDYEWALRRTIASAQDDAFLRSLPPEFDPSVPHWWEIYQPNPSWDHNAEMREVAMADNVLWVQERERDRGKVLYFAHDEHVETGLGFLGSPGHPPPGQYRQIRSAGSYLRSALGLDLVVIGTYFGHGEGFASPDVPAAAVHSMEDLFGSISVSEFLIDLHELPTAGPLYQWFQTAHATRASILREAIDSVKPRASYDAILYIGTVTPSFVPHKQ